MSLLQFDVDDTGELLPGELELCGSLRLCLVGEVSRQRLIRRILTVRDYAGELFIHHGHLICRVLSEDVEDRFGIER